MERSIKNASLAVIVLLLLLACGSAGTWGREDSGDGQFWRPYGVAVDGNGNVYVAEYYSERIQKFTSDGAFLAKWGSQGSGDGQFGGPQGIAVDGSGNVYVAEYGNHRIQKFTSDGAFLAKWGGPGSGTGDGQFDRPVGIAVDGSGNVYVADTFNNRIQKFTSGGAFLAKWGREGSGDGQFDHLTGVAVDGNGNVYVADMRNQRIQKFTSDGTFLAKWGSKGTDDGQLSTPRGVAVDGSGNVYVADQLNHRIQKFTSDGAFLAKWGGHGKGDGQFDSPLGVAVDGSGNVYVIDYGNDRIQKFAVTPPTTTPTPTSTPALTDDWPMFRHDLVHSGVAGETVEPPLTVMWTRQLVAGDSSPAVSGGAVYVGSSDYNVYALDAETGEVKWTHKTGGWVYSSPAVSGDVVYVGSSDSNVYALNATSGEVKWMHETGGLVMSSPAVSGGVVYIGSHDKKVYALNATSGEVKWTRKAGYAIASSPAVSGGVVYILSNDDMAKVSHTSGKVYALDAETGEVLWTREVGGGLSSPAVVNGVVYVGSWDHNVYALGAETGEVKWTYKTGYLVYSSPAVSGDVVYVGSSDSNVYALNATSGEVRWTHETGDRVTSSPVVSGGVVYIGSDDKNVYALDAETGEVLWTHETGSPVTSSPAVSGGVLYVGSKFGGEYNNKFYAFSTRHTPTPKPSSTSPSSTSPPLPEIPFLQEGEQCQYDHECGFGDCFNGHCCPEDSIWSSHVGSCFVPGSIPPNGECLIHQQCSTYNCINAQCCVLGETGGLLGCQDYYDLERMLSYSIIAIGCILILIKLFLLVAERREIIRTFISEGKEALAHNEYENALRAFESILEVDRNHIEADELHRRATFLLGEEVLKDKRYDEAITLYQDLVLKEENNPDAWKNLGQAFLGAGLKQKARDAFERSIRLYEDRRDLAAADEVSRLLQSLSGGVTTGIIPRDPSTGVEVKRGYERSGEWIKLGIKVVNNTGLVINNVTVQIDEYPSALQYEQKMKKASVDLQSINPGELQSAIFRFKPTRCVDGSITGFVRYTDAKGKKHTIDIESIEVKSVCPMLTSDGVDYTEVVERLMEESLTCNKVFIEFEGNVRSVFDVVQARLGRLILYDHDWRISESAYIGHLFYLGKTKYAKKYFAAEFLLSGTSEDKGGLTISVYSDEPAILTGFFHEIVSDLENHITVLKESSEACGIGCGKCGGPLDIENVVEGGYVKCDHCDFWNRVPKWKRQG